MQPVQSGSRWSKAWLSGAARGVGYEVDEVGDGGRVSGGGSASLGGTEVAA